MEAITRPRVQVKQEPLPHDVAKRIREQLASPAAAAAAQHQIETCTNFLAATLQAGGAEEGRAAVAKRKLEAYMGLGRIVALHCRPSASYQTH